MLKYTLASIEDLRVANDNSIDYYLTTIQSKNEKAA